MCNEGLVVLRQTLLLYTAWLSLIIENMHNDIDFYLYDFLTYIEGIRKNIRYYELYPGQNF